MATLLALARDTKTQPLIWLFATLLAYRLCLTIQQKTKGHPLANPVGMAILLLSVLIQCLPGYRNLW